MIGDQQKDRTEKVIQFDANISHLPPSPKSAGAQALAARQDGFDYSTSHQPLATSHSVLTRRSLLAAVFLTACGRRKVRGFPGYAFVANGGERSVAAVDLTTFTLAKRIGLEAPPATVI